MRKRACVIIIDDNKILLMHRIKNWKEYYTIPGGWIEKWETPEQTAIREIKEETNLDIVLENIFCRIVDKWHDGTYYLTRRFIGTEKLWWPESLKIKIDNQYDLQRIKKEELVKIPLLPLEIKHKIIEYFDTNN